MLCELLHGKDKRQAGAKQQRKTILNKNIKENTELSSYLKRKSYHKSYQFDCTSINAHVSLARLKSCSILRLRKSNASQIIFAKEPFKNYTIQAWHKGRGGGSKKMILNYVGGMLEQFIGDKLYLFLAPSELL